MTQVRKISAHAEIAHGAGSPGPEDLVRFAHAEIALSGDRPRNESDAVDGPVSEDVLNAVVTVLADWARSPGGWASGFRWFR